MKRIDDDRIIEALIETGGDQTAAAKLLGVSASTVNSRLTPDIRKALGIQKLPRIPINEIIAAVVAADGNMSAASLQLGLSSQAVHQRLRSNKGARKQLEHLDLSIGYRVPTADIIDAIQDSSGNIAHAAAALGTSTGTIYRRMHMSERLRAATEDLDTHDTGKGSRKATDEQIIDAMKMHAGNYTRAARTLGLTTGAVWRRVNRNVRLSEALRDVL